MVVVFLVIVPVARAELTVNVGITGTGHGTVTNTGEAEGAIGCSGPPATPNPPGACSAAFGFGSTFHAGPDPGSNFNGWTVIRNGEPQPETCANAAEPCTVFAFSNASYEITAAFVVLLPAPTVTIQGPTGIGSEGATFQGAVNANGNDARWRFEYRPTGSSSWEKAPIPDGDAGAGEAAEPVEATVQGLEPNTEYEVRLWSGNGTSSATSAIETFSTHALPPGVSTGGAFSISDTTATLTATVDPHHATLTDCHFEYGTGEGYGQIASCSPGPAGITNPDEVQQIAVRATHGTFALSFLGVQTGPMPFNAPASTVQAELRTLSSIGAAGVSVIGGPGDTSGSHPYLVTFEGALGDRNVEALVASEEHMTTGETVVVSTVSPGGFPVQVTADVSGLSPESVYHYRVVTANACGGGCGGTVGADRSFETRPPVRFPARHYELVSAADTNGEEAIPNLSSVDGERFSYSSFLPSPPDPVSGFFSTYVASRNPDGSWTQKGVEAPPGPGEQDLGTASIFFSADLSKAAVSTDNALDPADRNGAYDTYYLDRPEGRHFAWVSRNTAIEGPQTEGGDAKPVYVTPDGADVLLESRRALLPSATAGVKELYEWESDTHALALVSRVPPPGSRRCDDTTDMPACLPSAAESVLGSGVEAGGAGSVLAPGTNYGAVSPDGRRVVFEVVGSQPGARRIFERIDGERTVEVSAGQGVTPPIAEPQNVNYAGTAEGGAVVFFTSSSALTPDSSAETGGGTSAGCGPGESSSCDLYGYGLEGDTLVDLTPSSGGGGVERVYAISNDGTRVYFSSSKRLDQTGHLTEEGSGLQGSPGGPNLYLAEVHGSSAVLTFIATIDPTESSPAWNAGLYRPQAQREVAATPDGSLLAFRDRLAAVPGRSTGGRPQVFVYDALRKELSCASCLGGGSLPAAANLVAAKGYGEVEPGEGLAGDKATEGAGPHPRSVSTDGAVFFQTKTPLLPTDTNGRIDVYEWRGNKVALISTGLGVQPSTFASASADGSTVFFQSADSLVAGAQAGILHIYAARVGPALESPTPGPPCVGADCRGPSSSPAAGAGPGSAVFQGPGNPAAKRGGAKRCAKGKVRKGERCVPKKRLHDRGHKRTGGRKGAR
ncbi:MAG: fibronectin type III domain-containing protein [Actinobacteria bacterium]|nr:fibronectin type III domain-containing protein [Actinomycetota bacterium]